MAIPNSSFPLPPMSPLNPSTLRDFRMTFYRWEFQDSDYINLQEEQAIKAYAKGCVEQLLPSLKKLQDHTLRLTPAQETDYLLTLLLAVELADLYSLRPRIVKHILTRIPQLPDSRHKTHLQTHLYIVSDRADLLAAALDASSAWDTQTLTPEDRYIRQYLQEEQEILILQP